MKRLLLFLALILFAFSSFSQNSTIKHDTYFSKILDAEKEYTIYLPVGYEESGEEYPILYLLHGAWGCHKDWSTSGSVKEIADLKIMEGLSLPLIIVMPDASGENPNKAGKNMGYFNQPGWAYEDHFFDEFIPLIESKYRVKSEKRYRAIAGLSMGGGGTMVYALHRPDLFGSAAPLSGLLGKVDRKYPSDAMTSDFNASIETNDALEHIRNATQEQLNEIRSVRWYIDCGDKDYLYKCNVDMYVLMREKDIPLQYRMRGGSHNWLYWRQALESVLTFVSAGFAQ